jgi:hypothetical protein
MTQPNQYEDKELREIENALMQLANFPSHHKLKKAMQLITQKQREARIDENNRYVFGSDARIVQQRIAELKGEK